MLSTRLVLLLLLLLVGSQHSSAAPYAPSECCYNHFKGALRLNVLKNFYETPNECALRSIVFVTKNGNKVCAGPNSPWVKKAIKNLQKEKDPQAV
ncbi:hypothetical protein ASZ78_009064 [Callipepla squamata]|uniref:C-C motif chemokine n=1 Tax=Callipepla squamata TaxID=9009 RepID=A0A226MU25_CALSU|nr:hypothetical protein ASZ78_009064 [Callipepla squamata]